MNLFSSQISTLILQLLPGFVTAGIFYTLTSHPKASEFERIIQALIFTVLLKLGVIPIRWLMLYAGHHLGSVGAWNAESELSWMTLLAFPLGMVVVWAANSDACHRYARKARITSRTSYPSEWYAAFTREKRWVILNMVDGRRLYGWPEEWPDQADKGHFVIDQPEWVFDDGSRVPVVQTSKYLVPAGDVSQVEFLLNQTELSMGEDEMRRIQEPLITLHGSNADGIKATATRTEPAAGKPAATSCAR